MGLIKSIWPTPFKIKEHNLASFLIQLIIFLVICAIAGVLIGWLSGIPAVGWIFTILGSLIELYSVIGVVLCILNFLGIM